MDKTGLGTRPVCHRIRNRIEGHICICSAAYPTMLELERLLKRNGPALSIEACRKLMDPVWTGMACTAGCGASPSFQLQHFLDPADFFFQCQDFRIRRGELGFRTGQLCRQLAVFFRQG